ncbi:MAG TPA: AAA family ATPase [Acidimicrobiales bacterium]
MPRLVLISGTPASGKTTLAHELGRILPCPVVSRDEIKEGLVHARDSGTPSWGDPIADEAFALFYRVVTEYLRSDCSVVAEAAFFYDLTGGAEALVRLSDACIVHCRVDVHVAQRRYTDRAESDPIRRISHPDDELVNAMEAGTFGWERYAPMEIGVPVLVVDTSDGYRPGLPDIVEFARR